MHQRTGRDMPSCFAKFIGTKLFICSAILIERLFDIYVSDCTTEYSSHAEKVLGLDISSLPEDRLQTLSTPTRYQLEGDNQCI